MVKAKKNPLFNIARGKNKNGAYTNSYFKES
jgi:hypothetical protein